MYDFAQNPTAIMPLSADSSEAWSSPVLQGVTHFSDFASVIVLTDSLESGRVWIEQTASARGKTPLILISSAQAGPMFLPYVDSGQVNGLITGLYGAAGAEQANGGLPSIGGAKQPNGSADRLCTPLLGCVQPGPATGGGFDDPGWIVEFLAGYSRPART